MKTDVYDIVTERIIAALEKGVCPWQKPWRTTGSDILPSNFVSRKPYQGVNTFLLLCTEFACPYWVTFKQAKDLGGSVKAGSKGFIVVYWNFLPKKDANGAPVIGSDGKQAKVAFLRYYTVFNLEQCEGIKWEAPKVPEGLKFEPLEQCEKIVAGMPNAPTLTHGGNRAYYAPSLDKVNMPPKEAFANIPAYYSTLFHELTHSTGHQSRLARKDVMSVEGFGTESYSKEELVAEMGAAFLCGHAGIVNATIDNTTAYLGAWIKRLKEDSKLIVSAASQAQKASNYILDYHPEEATSTEVAQ